MRFEGEIVFGVYDNERSIEAFDNDFDEMHNYKKGEKGKYNIIAKNYSLICTNSFSSKEELVSALEKTARCFMNNKEHIADLLRKYDKVMVKIDVRAECDQIGFLIPNEFLRAVSSLGLNLDIDTIIGLNDE